MSGGGFFDATGQQRSQRRESLFAAVCLLASSAIVLGTPPTNARTLLAMGLFLIGFWAIVERPFPALFAGVLFFSLFLGPWR